MSGADESRRRVALLLASGAGVAGLLLRGGAFAAGLSCERAPRETPGPFPGNGTNSNAGRVVNALADDGIVRSDIRSSFGRSTARAPGVPLELTLTLRDAKRGCTPLAGHAIHLWHADRRGEYSLYQGQAERENYLRGVQVTDAQGRARFVTIYPSCYGGRYPHIHFEVFRPMTGGFHATDVASHRTFVSQVAMPADPCLDVYRHAEGYEGSRDNFARMRFDTDGVFRDNTPAQREAMTPQLRGTSSFGFTGTVAIAI